jgi:O-antigen/teichoic acid export membrane protein
MARNYGLIEVSKLVVIIKYCTAAGSILWIIFTSFWPAYARAKCSNDVDWISRQFVRNILLAVILGCCAGVVTLLFGDSFVFILSKDLVGFDKFTYIAVALWLISYAIWCAVASFLNGTARYRESAIAALLLVLITLITLTPFIKRYGVNGVLISLTLSTFFIATAFAFINWRKQLSL